MHTDWSLFLGRFHPLIVHLPIGILLFAVLLKLLAARTRIAIPGSIVNIALLTGAISAGLAVLSGFFLSRPGGYNPNTLFWHQWIGITAALLTFIAWLLRFKKADRQLLRLSLSSWLLCLILLLITLGGHLGGKMTHGEGYLTRYMPGFLKAIFNPGKQPVEKKRVPPLDSVVVYTDIIQPIFNAKCVRCHNADKDKGELNLATTEGLLKGGKSGNTIVAGNIEKSELLRRITLAPGSSKFMPSDNNSPLTAPEIHFIREWIQTGAGLVKNISVSGTDEKTRYLIATWLGIDPENEKEIKLPEAPPADTATIRQLQEMKLIVRPLSAASNLLEVSFVMVRKAGPLRLVTMLEKLSLIKQQLYRLDVSDCSLTGECLKIITGFNRLEKLELQKNNLTDESLGLLSSLQELEVLNAGQNPLTDKIIPAFKKLKALKKINLWQTGVTEQAAGELQAALPGLTVER